MKDFQAKEATMKFLMGVNDVFSQVKTQILLMDPLPSINKAHSLFIQEEMQRSVTNSVRVESTILATKSLGNNPKGKERPLCTHCGKLGHTVDKCYKLHGFPPGYKFKNRNMMAYQVSIVANQFQSHYLAPNIRAVHGSIQVGFVPNPEPTRWNRVNGLMTHRRPLTTSGRVGSVSGRLASV